jgi:murein L,D-transpeptidase YcbB/YkuD
VKACRGLWPLACAGAVLALACGPLQPAGRSSDDAREAQVAEILRARVTELRQAGRLRVGESWLASRRVLPDLYESQAYRPVWTPSAADALLEAIRDAESDGLDPRDYLLEPLERLRAESRRATLSPPRRADLELLLTDAAVRLGAHLRLGKTDPTSLDPNWHLEREYAGDRPSAVLLRALAGGRLREVFAELRPAHPSYAGLVRALADHRAIAASGGWPEVPEGPPLHPGDADARVPALRRRLEASGDLAAGSSGAAPRFDAALEAAVRRFQARHALTPDGVVGARTYAALRVPARARVGQIRVNLERARWALRDLPERYVEVDVAGFHVTLWERGEKRWRARAVVGEPSWETPVFRSLIRSVLLNPSWTVPPGMLAKEVLPEIRRDRGYLARKHLEVVDEEGRRIDPGSVDFHAGRFSYRLRQAPGSENSLGRIKFEFASTDRVYLHDTPSKELFERPERARSHGCIRVEQPFELAALLFGATWDAAGVERVVASDRTQRLALPEPVAVLILYWTAEAEPDGAVTFHADPYGHDAPVLAALDGAFALVPPPAFAP